MAYFKVRLEIWCDGNPAESDLEETARHILAGEAICTSREVVTVVDRPQDIENDAAMAFFGGEEGDADERERESGRTRTPAAMGFERSLSGPR